MLETNLKNKIIDCVEAHLSSTDQFLVDVSLSSCRAPGKIKVTIDGNVAVADCAHLTRLLVKQLTYDVDMTNKYGVEVSTPGLDAPLKLIRQYKKNRGRQLRIILKNGENLQGLLLNVTDDAIHLDRTAPQNEPFSISFSEIEKAFVQVSFK